MLTIVQRDLGGGGGSGLFRSFFLCLWRVGVKMKGELGGQQALLQWLQGSPLLAVLATHASLCCGYPSGGSLTEPPRLGAPHPGRSLPCPFRFCPGRQCPLWLRTRWGLLVVQTALSVGCQPNNPNPASFGDVPLTHGKLPHPRRMASWECGLPLPCPGTGSVPIVFSPVHRGPSSHASR